MDPSRVPEYVMNTLCRICAEKSSKLNPILKYESLSLKIFKCLSIEISEFDHLPLNICESCCFKVDGSYALYESAHKADEKLKKLWKILIKETMTYYPDMIVERSKSPECNVLVTEETPGVIAVPEENLTKMSPNLIISVQEDLIDNRPQIGNLGNEVMVIGKTIAFEIFTQNANELMEKSERDENVGVKIQELEQKENWEEEQEKNESIICAKSTNKVYHCQFCSCQLSSLASLSYHESTHSEDRPFLCDTCGKSFKHANNLRCHTRIHLAVRKKYICKICSKSFLTNYFLKEHMNLHTGERPYKCTICGKEFREKVHLRNHKWTHSDEEFKCSICDTKFNRKGNLKEHIKKFHKDYVKKNELPQKRKVNENTQIKCPSCNLTFSTQVLLKNHLKSHTEQKKFFCTICGKKFRHSGSLTYHRRTAHTGEKPFKCTYCDEKFSLRSVQIIHERKKHTFEQPYKCTFCSRLFTNSSSLRNHSFIHSKDKFFECDECGKKFSRSSNLCIHKKLHSNDRQFSCDQCDKTYIQKHDLIKHKKLHDPKSKPFFCKYCGNSFSHKKDSSKHSMCQFDFLRKVNSDISSAEKILETVTTDLEKNGEDFFAENQLILESVEELAGKETTDYQETNSLNS